MGGGCSSIVGPAVGDEGSREGVVAANSSHDKNGEEKASLENVPEKHPSGNSMSSREAVSEAADKVNELVSPKKPQSIQVMPGKDWYTTTQNSKKNLLAKKHSKRNRLED